MIIANFYNIKSTNGIFFYGLDYIFEFKDDVRFIIVRGDLNKIAVTHLNGFKVISGNPFKIWFLIVKFTLKGDFIYTPSPHPLPFLARQLIVLHDAYPFSSGAMALFKKILLKISLISSRCKVGYINNSDSLAFLLKILNKRDRFMFCPNKFPSISSNLFENKSVLLKSKLLVGLMGTDSLKKNYHLLFNAVMLIGCQSQLHFYIYGHESLYLIDLMEKYPSIQITLFKSDDYDLDDFLGMINVVASVASQEGFGRPIAAAMVNNIPCYLKATSVFREFFPGALFFDQELELVRALQVCATDGLPPSSFFMPPVNITSAYWGSINQIRNLALKSSGIQ